MRYKYEFDLGPDGLELARASSRPESAGANDWIAGMPGGCWGEDAIKLSAISANGPAGFDAAVWEEAKTGDQNSELLVGIYFVRKGTAQDDAQAVDWIKRASNQGNDAADFWLGLLYEEGRGVKQDYHEAMIYYSSAAEHGYALAELNLGILYYTGRGATRLPLHIGTAWLPSRTMPSHRFSSAKCTPKGEAFVEMRRKRTCG